MERQVLMRTAVLALLLGVGCLRQTAFPCSTDRECVTADHQGTCETSVGYCSLPDSTCLNGRRFSDVSGPYAGTCVGAPGDDGGPPVDLAPTGSVTLGPSRDVYINQDTPDVSYAINATMKVDGNGTGIKIKRALLMFDLPMFPPGANITSAMLNACITMLGGGSAGTTHQVHRVTSDWTSSVTWTLRPMFDAGISASTVVPATAQCVTYDVVADVLAWKAGTATNSGWQIMNANENLGGSSLDYGASENANPAVRPSLTINYSTP